MSLYPFVLLNNNNRVRSFGAEFGAVLLKHREQNVLLFYL